VKNNFRKWTCATTVSFTLIASAAAHADNGAAAASAIKLDQHILVDQFGYRPQDPKVAVIRTPHVGYDASDTFSPGGTYQLRRAEDGTVEYSAAPVPWNHGAVEASSGDSGWWFDFSSVSRIGRYFVYDVARNVRSAPFSIDEHVYRNVLKAAMRTFFYQRSGSTDGGGAKPARFAGACWSDEPAYVGSGQDGEARDVTDQSNRSKVHDLSGGWFDAGDTNKYVTFAASPVHQLLTAFQISPGAFTDDFSIPESGNGIPDLIDEIRYELQFIKRMQFAADGSVALKVGSLGYPKASPPSSDRTPRYYVPACTSSTIAAAGMFAHASYVFGRIPTLESEAADLKTRAINAWNSYQHSALQEHCDSGVVKSGNADWSADAQHAAAVVAAVYLYAITGTPAYSEYLKNNLTATNPYRVGGWSRYVPQDGEALLFYTTLSNADQTLKKRIRADKLADSQRNDGIYGAGSDDLYRAYLNDEQYHWGSNEVRANYGNTNADLRTYSIDVRDTSAYERRALDTLHYFHGVNPFAKVYLSNMSSYGATSSINALFHYWYMPGTKWGDASSAACGPAPGYVPGGPVATAGSQGVPPSLMPPVNQPAQKSFRDWNGLIGNPQNSWVITEPAIYYQASYIELLSRFVH